MPRAYLCDFDGTVSPTDVGADLVCRFSLGREAERSALLERWRAGALGHRELTEQVCGLLAVTEPEALAFSRRSAIDPAFVPFVRRVLSRGDQVMVVSEGFGFYVADQLARAGLPDLPWAANHARFTAGRLVPEFPWSDPSCSRRCGNCKALHVRRHRALGHEVVLVGDGLSDRCGAACADRVFARAALLEWCRSQGVPAEPFDSFASLAEAAAA